MIYIRSIQSVPTEGIEKRAIMLTNVTKYYDFVTLGKM